MATRVTIKIGTESRILSDAREDWINEQIRRRRAEGPVCVLVHIEGQGVDITLMTPACSSGPGGRRRLTNLESEIVELWKKRGLNEPDFSGGNVVAFLRQLRKLLGM